METPQTISFNATHHRDPRVQRLGFDLDDRYVEQCWTAVVGPTATLLLRRLPVLWQQEVPAVLDAAEFGRSLGVGSGLARTARLPRTIARLEHYGLLSQTPGRPDEFDAYLEVPPLSPRQLDRLPTWTRQAHERLLDAHLERRNVLGPETRQHWHRSAEAPEPAFRRSPEGALGL